MDEQLTTRQVADALNVSESSVKRWCDQGAIPTIRTVGGHRRISSDAFRQFVEKTKRGGPGMGEPNAPPTSTSLATVEELSLEFEKSILEGNEAACSGVLVKAYAESRAFATLADELIAPTFRRLGEMWTCGDIEIFQERRGCEICQRALHHLLRTLPAESAFAPMAVGGTPAGDHYSLSNQLTELVLRESDWGTRNLGSNLPLRTIAAAALKFGAKLVWLSVSHLEDEQRFVDEFAQFRQQLPPHTPIVLGGRALHDQLRPKLQYTAHCDNLQQLTAFSRALRQNQWSAN